MTFKQHIAKFMLFMLNEHIKENWDEWNPIGKIIIYPFWLVKSIIFWILFPLFIPGYLFRKTTIYKKFNKEFGNFSQNSPNMKEINKLQTNAFLNGKYNNSKKTARLHRNRKI